MQQLKLEGEAAEQARNALDQSPLLAALGEESRRKLLEFASLVELEPDEALQLAGQPPDAFLLLVSGEAAICLDRDRGGVELGRVRPPEAIGILGLLLGEPQLVTVLAAGPCRALRFDAKAFQAMHDRLPGFSRALSRGLARWLKNLAHQVPLPRHEAEAPPASDLVQLLPLAFLERHRVLPVLSDGNRLTLGFVGDPTPEALSGARQLLPGMEVQPVRIAAALLDRALAAFAGIEPLRHQPGPPAAHEPPRSPELDKIIERVAAEGASDLHLSAGQRPRWRVDGRMIELADAAVLGADEVLALFAPVLDPRKRAELDQQHDVDFGYTAGSGTRVRANLFRNRFGYACTLRLVSGKILSFEQLGLPEQLSRLCELPKGLVLVTGPTGSGKSTTLAAMIDWINRRRPVHILTLEDPIEFLHPSLKALVTQREIGTHASGFARALRAALREDPDVILVGEMRDRETTQLALEAANTGHLVFSTLHTASAVTTVDRIVDLFPPDQQAQVRTSLAEILRGVVCQSLCRRSKGGRVAAVETMFVNHAISNLIGEGKTSQLPNIMQTTRAEGNRLLNDHLAELVKGGVIDHGEALAAAEDKKDLERRLPAQTRQPPVSTRPA